MALKIKKKKNENKKLAVITILGVQGGYISRNTVKFTDFENKAKYYFENNKQNKKEYFNTLPLLIEKFSNRYNIIPIMTQDSKLFNKEVLKKGYSDKLEKIEFSDNFLIKDEKNIDDIFELYNKTIDSYDEVIVDVTHGFRHLPLLMLVELVIQNFKSIEKIKHIYFAKEIIKHDKNNKGLYEIIDLKEYVDLANISFILTNFKHNFTISNHIKSKKYLHLLKALNNFSNDMMALNLNNLFTVSSKKLIDELLQINNSSIKTQALELSKYIEKISSYQGKKRYRTYFDLAEELFNRNYMLISLSLLYESVRLYIKTTIKQEQNKIVNKVEVAYDNDLYKIGDFFTKLKSDKYDYEKSKSKSFISLYEFNILKQAFPKQLLEEKKYILSNSPQILIDAIAHIRNNLAHANVKDKFKNIKTGVQDLLDDYKNIIEK